MPSLRKRVSSYFRQLSFHNEPRDKRHNINENSFITKYLQGQISLKEGPAIIHGKTPTDLPNFQLGSYEVGSATIKGCYTGPNGGLATVKRIEKHLSVLDPDIDFIDTPAPPVDECPPPVRKSPQHISGQPVDNTTMTIKVAGQEYFVTNQMTKQKHNKSHSLGSVSDFDLVAIEKTKIDRRSYQPPSSNDNNNRTTKTRKVTAEVDVVKEGQQQKQKDTNFALAKSKSEGNPFRHKKRQQHRGRIIKVAERPPQVNSVADGAAGKGGDTEAALTVQDDDALLPTEWNVKDDSVYGLSDSLYDRNQVTGNKNGDPIADCFGVISRGDSALLAVADGVNWGEKASVAAKSAVHGCLHYLNKTLFGDTKAFDKLTVKADDSSDAITMTTPRVANTRDVFIGLLRAFNCAHDLILENNGMLTTLTVAVVLPVKSNKPYQFVCCVCNVGDTLAYVYSQKYGLRELTKGSHDINSNRDMRDALGALGPVDGINPELSNLTLSVTTLHRGDIVMVASDGLTDNFDSNVCRFTANSLVRQLSNKQQQQQQLVVPPVKPPRKRLPATVKPSNESVAVNETKSSSLRRQISTTGRNQATASQQPPPSATNYKFMRSKTSVEIRSHQRAPPLSPRHHILRNDDGIPYVTPIQRYELQLLLMEDILKNGISGQDTSCTSARKLCENLVNFTFSITSAKRRTLEDQDLYFDNRDDVMVEVSTQEKKVRRKRGLERVQNLPGKLDHVTVVAWVVGGGGGTSQPTSAVNST